MTIELVRIDERLLHGQVVVGWGEHLGLELYLVVDREIAGSSWEEELWSAGVPSGIEVRFLAPGEVSGVWEDVVDSSHAAAVLTRGTAAMRELAEDGRLRGRKVNVGVIHDREDRRRATESVYLSEGEIEDLRAMEAAGSRVEARDLPGGRPVPLEKLTDAASLD